MSLENCEDWNNWKNQEDMITSILVYYDTNERNDKGDGGQDIPSFQCKVLELQFCCQVVRIYTSSATSAIIHVEEAVDLSSHVNSQQNQYSKSSGAQFKL